MSTSPVLEPEQADALLLLAWSPFGAARLEQALRKLLGSRGKAAAALQQWHPLPLSPGEPLPGGLPGGIALPAATTPWPRADSPVPGVDLPTAAVGDLARDMLTAHAALDQGTARKLRRGHVERLGALAGGMLDERTLGHLLENWLTSGTALRCAELTGGAPTPAVARAEEDDPGEEAESPSAPTTPGVPTLTPRQRLRAALDELLIERPLHWTILGRAQIRPDDSTETMCVGLTHHDELYLFWNPGFVMGLEHDEIKGVLVHEVNHVLFGHLSEVPSDANEHELAWTLACECTANEYVPYPLGPGPVTHELLRLPPNESTMARFEALRERTDLPKCGRRDFLVKALRSGPKSHGNTIRWDASYPVELVEQALDEVERLDGQTTAGLQVHRGSVPVAALNLLTPGVSKLDWRTLLKHLAGGIRRTHTSRAWPNRRRPEMLGVVPGRRTRREQPSVMAAIDTSGSMSASELAAAAAELQGLLDQRVKVAVVQCDTVVREHGWLLPGTQVRRLVGGGGTNLCPPFGSEMRNLYRPALIVYFTDGYGPAPLTQPADTEVLWVLTGREPKRPAPWGRAVLMGT